WGPGLPGATTRSGDASWDLATYRDAVANDHEHIAVEHVSRALEQPASRQRPPMRGGHGRARPGFSPPRRRSTRKRPEPPAALARVPSPHGSGRTEIDVRPGMVDRDA